ncbi:hypothetical protein QVA48_00565 [Staphylococcus haemolyticus]|uniref:hypothetical protein n=1 Tax=Staphylococcus haemolyticus TaxID=1283 RepID=UPI0029037A79|nr:hypothetical protein [Staphylococcus haemolyticus]MDU0433703.1 hypothetical protein [Staphylococcus haemolyticus]
MSKIIFKKIQEKTLDELEKEINMYLESDEGSQFEVLNISIDKIEERKFPNNEEVHNAILILNAK